MDDLRTAAEALLLAVDRVLAANDDAEYAEATLDLGVAADQLRRVLASMRR